jgi:acyl-CoA thioester hydrolase
VSLFVWQARVYWEDTDGGGVVYYANYLKFLERARTEWLRANGIGQSQLKDEHGVVFAIVSVNASFLLPARIDDLLFVSCEPSIDGGASILFQQRIWRERRGEVDGDLLLEATVRAACLDSELFKPRRIPDCVREVLD